MTFSEITQKMKGLSKHPMVVIYHDGSGLVNIDFTDRTRETEVAFSDEKQLELILERSQQQHETATTDNRS